MARFGEDLRGVQDREARGGRVEPGEEGGVVGWRWGGTAGEGFQMCDWREREEGEVVRVVRGGAAGRGDGRLGCGKVGDRSRDAARREESASNPNRAS